MGDLVLLGLCQVSAPVYKLCMTDLGGEQRFAAAVARRLQSLGALTRGDRRAASGVDLSESNFDSPLGRKSLRWESWLFQCLLVLSDAYNEDHICVVGTAHSSYMCCRCCSHSLESQV